MGRVIIKRKIPASWYFFDDQIILFSSLLLEKLQVDNVVQGQKNISTNKS